MGASSKTSFLIGAAAMLAMAPPATAWAQERSFNLPAQSATKSIPEFARQAGIQIVAPGSKLRTVRTRAIKGQHDVRAALQTLLEGTGLRIVGDDGRTITLGAASPTASQPTAAATASPLEAADAVAPTLGGDIVVTAQKRSERLIDTPQSVSVLSSESLAKLGATQFRDYANTVPGLTFTTGGAGYTQISLRGVTAGIDVSPTVGLYFDDVPYGSSSALARGSRFSLDSALFDVDRIEVLRGPQGTLYGASAIGGILKYVSKQPSLTDFGGEAQAGVSDTHFGGMSYQFAGVVDAPIVTDKAGVRVSGFYNHDGGFIDNLARGQKDVDRSKTYGGRVDVLLKPTEQLSIRLTGFLQNVARDGTATADYNFDGTPVDGSLDQRRPLAEPFNQRFRIVSGTISYDLGAATLTSISAYQTSRTHILYDLTSGYAPLLADFGTYSAVGIDESVKTKKFTQELRLASKAGSPIEWIVGGFYNSENSERLGSFAVYDADGRPAPNIFYDLNLPSHYHEYAVFGDVTWHLSSKFDVTGGVRYSHDSQDATQTGSGIFVGSLPTSHSREHVFNYLANARYHLSDHATAYLRFATGYRPGGPNLVVRDPLSGLPSGAPTFAADRLKSYEAGVKAETADRTFGVDLGAYYIDWNNIQVIDATSAFGGIANAKGGATVRGAELSLTARPDRGLTIVGAFAYQDAHLERAETDLGGAKGEQLPNVPRFTASILADYTVLGSPLRPTVGATLRFVDKRDASFNASASFPQYRLPEYSSVDLRAGVTLGPVDAQLYVHNLFDRRGQLSAILFAGLPQPALLQPRTIGITATSRF